MTEDNSVGGFTAQNLKAWGEAAPIHAAHNQEGLLKAFAEPGYSCLDAVATARLEAVGVAGRDVVQICCNNGCEILSVKTMGAARAVGLDGVEAFLDQGRALAKAAGQDVEFVACDAYAIPEALRGGFDVALITIGVLSWMPDLDRFLAGVAAVLRPGGVLLIYEHHPILEMFEPGSAEDPVRWELSYFDTSPYIEEGGLDYFGGPKYDATPVASFMHKISDVVMACLRAGLLVSDFQEYPHHISNTWYNVEASGIGVPMCYTLEVRR